MPIRRLSFACIVIACVLISLIILNSPWSPSRQFIVPYGSDSDQLDEIANAWKSGREKGQFKEPKVEVTSPYQIGRTKPAGSNYTRGLVVSKLNDEDTSWISESLGDMLDAGLLKTAIYTAGGLQEAFHLEENNGHEALAYLSYIIDSYTDVPDVVIFMHAHRFAWHNNALLDKDSALMVRHLSPERVTREGYMNLRCHWDPGCPDWLKPGEMDYDEYKREQKVLAKSWPELFPRERLPSVLAQPCCAQFGVSRERIQVYPERALRFAERLDPTH